MTKSTVQIIQKNRSKNTKYSKNETILKIHHHPLAKPLQNPHFGSKIKIPKNMSKSILQIISTSVQNSAPKNIKYPRKETILKTGHHEKAIAFAKPLLWVKNQNSKKHTMSKSILQIIQSCSMQKTARTDTKYSRNQTILKITHHAQAIALAKSSLWVKNQNSTKHVKINSTNHLELFCAKNHPKTHEIFEK